MMGSDTAAAGGRVRNKAIATVRDLIHSGRINCAAHELAEQIVDAIGFQVLVPAAPAGVPDRLLATHALSAPAASGAVPGIYIASKAVHGSKWREWRDVGHPIISTWIDEAEQGKTTDWADLWSRCIAEASSAAVTIVYREPGEELKGARAEVGAALASGRHVIVVGDIEDSWTRHPNVTRVESVNVATAYAGVLIRDAARLAAPPSGERSGAGPDLAGVEALFTRVASIVDRPRDGSDAGKLAAVRRELGEAIPALHTVVRALLTPPADVVGLIDALLDAQRAIALPSQADLFNRRVVERDTARTALNAAIAAKDARLSGQGDGSATVDHTHPLTGDAWRQDLATGRIVETRQAAETEGDADPVAAISKLSCDEQFAAASRIAGNIGYDLTPEGGYDAGEPVRIAYTNWRGEPTSPVIVPARIFWGSNEWHPEPCWLIEAFDVGKQAMRTFDVRKIASWQPRNPLEPAPPVASAAGKASR